MGRKFSILTLILVAIMVTQSSMWIAEDEVRVGLKWFPVAGNAILVMAFFLIYFDYFTRKFETKWSVEIALVFGGSFLGIACLMSFGADIALGWHWPVGIGWTVFDVVLGSMILVQNWPRKRVALQ